MYKDNCDKLKEYTCYAKISQCISLQKHLCVYHKVCKKEFQLHGRLIKPALRDRIINDNITERVLSSTLINEPNVYFKHDNTTIFNGTRPFIKQEVINT